MKSGPAKRVAIRRLLIFVGLLLCVMPTAFAADVPVRLAAGGKPLVPIIVAESASEPTRKTAQTLATQLKKITNATFEVRAGDGASGIVVGMVRDFPMLAGELPREPKEDERETYRLRSHERGVWLIGTTELAVEHAVWDVLHRLGYRQFFPGPTWEVVPHSPELSIAVDVVERPSYLARSIWYGYGLWDHAKEHYEDWCRKNRATKRIDLDTGHVYELIHCPTSPFCCLKCHKARTSMSYLKHSTNLSAPGVDRSRRRLLATTAGIGGLSLPSLLQMQSHAASNAGLPEYFLSLKSLRSALVHR